jgi:hypothetical protein
VLAHLPGLLGQPVTVCVQVAFAGLADLFGGEQARDRQGLQIVECHDVQRQVHRARQCGGTIERRCVRHGGRGNQQ